ncbi:substrate carrier family protein a [Anaeramoeba ignava]|uniref:Substrate carrier family protein a n=1 Tax=Anaeramoeba ignava TaxID=1746090 RepID=A0A9Q0LKV7_ANAIG|nr:substrate carrier family protein a [Anaeramoeba ignava]|eukprot:Anaeramoba_ignava/a218627_892.p1 GENE.a218627_892~~a218627_892.p1  ORF type:complete len:344 (-),score=99.72 a218627_892:119-1096(-)
MSLGTVFAKQIISNYDHKYTTMASPKDKGNLTTVQGLLAGGLAGAVARTATSPLDVIKILFQVQKGPSHEAKYKGLGDAFATIYREEGLGGFWKGNWAGCLRIAPYSAIKFATFERLRKVVGKGQPLSSVQRLICGSLAGTIGLIFTYPFDVVKTRMTVDSRYTGITDTFAKIIQEEGIGGLFGGIIPSVVGVIPYEGGQFFAYGAIKSFWEGPEKRQLSVIENLLVGSLAGAFGQTISYPFDVIRKRLQIQRKSGKQEYSGMIDCAVKIVKDEGFTGLYKGNVPNLIKVLPYAALTFTTYEQVKKFFENYNNKRKAQATQPKKK